MKVTIETSVTPAQVVESDLLDLLLEYQKELDEVLTILRPLQGRVVAAKSRRHELSKLRECAFKLTGKTSILLGDNWPSPYDTLITKVVRELKTVTVFLEG